MKISLEKTQRWLILFSVERRTPTTNRNSIMKSPASKAAALMGSAKSEAKTAAARENGARGGRPKKGAYDSTFHRDGSVTVWDSINQGWIRTSRPSEQLLATLSNEERERVVSHVG
jgi:hypothetical protein